MNEKLPYFSYVMRHIFIILLTISGNLCAQEETNYLNFYTTKDGLSNNTVYSITQDSRGFLWLGTKEGLNRFDGLQFKKFFADKNPESGLSNNNIFDVLEYQYGQLLIATSNGISVYNSLTGKFENDKIKFAGIKAGSSTVINSLFKNKQGQIWVNHSGELDVLDSNLNYIERFTNLSWATGLKGILIRFERWYQDKTGRLWLPSDTTGINIIDFNAKKVWNYKNNPDDLPYLKQTYIRAFLLDENSNSLWYAPWGSGLYKYDFITKKEQHLSFSKMAGEASTINSIIRSTTGLYCGGGQLYEVDTTTLAYKIIDKNYAISLFKTADAIYWEATEQGLIKLPGLSAGKDISFVINSAENILYPCTDMMISRTGNLYATYSNALIQVNINRITFTLNRLASRENISLNRVCEDKTGNIWVGSSRGIYIFDPARKSFIKPSFLPSELTSLHINEIFCDSDGDMWIGTRTPFYLFRFLPGQNKTEKITDNVIIQFTQKYRGNRVFSIAEDKNHTLWMISQLGGGIICYEKQNNKWKSITPRSGENSLLQRGLTSVNTDLHDHLWLTDYFGNGLLCYNYKTDSLIRFSRNDGLFSDFVKNVCADTSGNLWLTTEYGITRFNVNDNSILNKGLPEIKFSKASLQQEAIYDPITNSVVYGEDNRLQFIPVNQILSPAIPPVPLLDKITINNRQKFIDPSGNKFILTWQERNIGIDFTGIRFLDADKVHFAYFLEGVDKEWQYTDINRSAQYANLAPRNYIFKIKSGNENNKWAAEYILLNFTITPPWWQTWWFRIIAALLIGSAVYAVLRRRIQQIKKEADLKHKIAETEMMALRAQMNPHFIFNCLNAIDNMIQTNQKDKATTYLTRFAQLIRLVLDSSKNNLVPFYKDYESLSLFLQLEKFRGNNKFEYELNADPEILNSGIQVPPLIIQPFVENAIHHGLMNKAGAERKLVIQISLEKDYIKYTIEDNGVGRQKAAELNNINRPEHISYGIEIAKKRIRLHNQNGRHPSVLITDLVNNTISTGTKVELWLLIK